MYILHNIISPPCSGSLSWNMMINSIHMGMDQYLLIPFLVGWTSINPSYFDVNYRGTIGFDTLPYDEHMMTMHRLSGGCFWLLPICQAKPYQDCEIWLAWTKVNVKMWMVLFASFCMWIRYDKICVVVCFWHAWEWDMCNPTHWWKHTRKMLR